PRCTSFPYTTLFRSRVVGVVHGAHDAARVHLGNCAGRALKQEGSSPQNGNCNLGQHPFEPWHSSPPRVPRRKEELIGTPGTNRTDRKSTRLNSSHVK